MSGVGNLSGGFFFPDLINDAVPERNAGPSLVYSLGSGVGEGRSVVGNTGRGDN